jgi:uncharacterized membrane protein
MSEPTNHTDQPSLTPEQRNDVIERENDYRYMRVERNYVFLYRIRMAWFIAMLAALAGALVTRRLSGKAILMFGASITLFSLPFPAIVAWAVRVGGAIQRFAGRLFVNPLRY